MRLPSNRCFLLFYYYYFKIRVKLFGFQKGLTFRAANRKQLETKLKLFL